MKNQVQKVTITILDITHRPFFDVKLNFIGLSISQETHYVSARAQRVNAIYRIVTTVY
jgi:hypothetical protein